MSFPRFWSAYLAYFLYLGAWGPYWSVYMKDGLGFGEGFVGWLGAVCVASLVVANFIFSRIADARRCRRRLLRSLSLLAVLSSAAWMWVRSPVAALLLMALHGALAQTQVPILDATTIDALGAERRRYGFVRIAGTLGWGIAAFGLGIFREADPNLIVWVMAGSMLLFHLTTWWLPDTQVPAMSARPSLRLGQVFSNPALRLFLLGALLHALSMAPYEVFGALYFKDAGLSPSDISWIYAVGIVVEILVFFASPWLLHRVPAVPVIVACALVALLRWILWPMITSPVLLGVLQLTHGICFGLWYAGCLHLLGHLVPAEVRTSGQAFFAMTYAIGIGIGGRLAGVAREGHNGIAALHGAAIAAICGALAMMFVSLRVRQETADVR